MLVARTKCVCPRCINVHDDFEHKIILQKNLNVVKSKRSDRTMCVADVLLIGVCPRSMPAAIFGLLLYYVCAYFSYFRPV